MVHEPSFPKSSIEYSESKPGFVTLTGKVEPSGYPFDKLAVMLFVWRFAPIHARNDDHGWCEASPHDYGPDEHGEWTVTDVPSGVQYAVLVVEGEYFMRSTHPDPLVELIEKLNDDSGAIPMKGLGLAVFTHRKYGVHIESAPDDHLTGAVLGVGRATWDEPGRDGPAGDYFQVAAWATNPTGTFFIGVRACEPSGYWTFGAIAEPLKSADSFTVALVDKGFNPPGEGAPTPPPVMGDPNILGLGSRPHEPLRTHGSSNPPRR